jgi:hypothetical protein
MFHHQAHVLIHKSVIPAIHAGMTTFVYNGMHQAP